MKRVAYLTLTLLILAGMSLGAQDLQSIRAQGMGGAFTAVADDSNALFVNPAGLAFLRSGELRIGTGVGGSFTKFSFFGEPAFPFAEQDWNNPSGDGYVVYDDFFGTPVPFDPADYGFPWSDEEGSDLPTYQEAVDQYQEFRSAYNTVEQFQNISDLAASPRLVLQRRGWAVGNINRVNLLVTPGFFDNNNPDITPLDVSVSRDGGLIAGLGLRFGPLAAGANARFFSRSTATASFTLDEFDNGPPEELVQLLLFGPDEGSYIAEESAPRLEVGVGGLFAFGPLNAGAYLDNLLAFLDGDEVDFGAIFDTLNFGVAWTPTNEKTSRTRSGLQLAAAADLRGIGSDTERVLTAGVEAGLDLGGVIVIVGRGGYRQPVPGNLLEVADNIDPRTGVYTVGGQLKFLFLEIQGAADLPADVLLNPPSYPLPEEQYADPFARVRLEVSIVF